MLNFKVSSISTAHLKALAERSDAVRTLLVNADITPAQWFEEKNNINSLLAAVSASGNGNKSVFVEEPNGNR
jgi:hypothetical protein